MASIKSVVEDINSILTVRENYPKEVRDVHKDYAKLFITTIKDYMEWMRDEVGGRLSDAVAATSIHGPDGKYTLELQEEYNHLNTLLHEMEVVIDLLGRK